MTALQEALPEFARLGTTIAAISVDSRETLVDLRKDCALTFPLLSDADREIVRQWGVFNRHERGGIAVPSSFVIDESGTVVYRSVDRIEARPEVPSLIEFLESLRSDRCRRLDNQKRRLVLPCVWDTVAAFPRKWFGRR